MIVLKRSKNDIRSKRASRIKRATGIVDACIDQNGHTRNSERIPASSAMNSDSPIPTGATKVALLFSAASMNMVNTSMVVKNISMKRPCVFDVPAPKDVRTLSWPGNRTSTMPAAVMPPMIWERKMRPPRTQGIAPTRHMPKVTAGLKSPPLILKKTQALTPRLKPKHRLM